MKSRHYVAIGVAILASASLRAVDLQLTWPMTADKSSTVFESPDAGTPVFNWSPVFVTTRVSQTNITVHSTAPAAFFVVYPTTTSMSVSWSPVTSPDTTIVSYNVYYWGLVPLAKVSVTNGATTTRLTGLIPRESYSVSVTALDINGNESNFSPPVTFCPPSTAGLKIALANPSPNAVIIDAAAKSR